MRESNKFDHNLMRHLHRLGKEQPDDLAQTRLQVSVSYTGELEELQHRGLRVSGNVEGIAIGDIAASDLQTLEQLENVRQISMQGTIGLHLDKSVPEIHADLVRKGDPAYTGAGVVIGIIDSGIDIFHKNFLGPDGKSRILSIWDQTISPPGTRPPTPFHIGAEFDKDAIKAALENPDQPFPHKDTLGHGTHIAGIAAGNGSQAGKCHSAGTFIGVAPEASLIAVKIVPDKDSTNTHTNMSAAVLYIYNMTVRQNPPKAAVVNISVRDGIGPHDGTTNVERFIDQLLTQSRGGFAVVVSAGNDGRKGSDDDWQRGTYNAGFHTSKQIAAHGHVTIPIIVPPDRTAVDHLEVWYSAGAGRLSVQVTGPTGIVAGPIGLVSPSTHLPLGPATVDITSTVNDANNQKGQISIAIHPPANGVIPAGKWLITLTETAGTAVSMDLWLINLEGHPTTVLDFPDRVTATTVNSPGTARNVITVGAYASKSGELGEFSSRGPTLAPDNRQKPDICAPGIRNSDASGITAPRANEEGGCCCDCCYSFYTDLRGTSQAAPHVSGVVALMLQRNAILTFEQIRATIQTFRRQPAGAGPLPNNDWGFGKVDAQLAIANIPPSSAFAGGPVVTADTGDSDETIVPTGSPIGERAGRRGAKRRVEPFPRLKEAFSPSALRIGNALRDVADRGKGNPGAQMMMALISTHFDEVFSLISRNRRVATKWRRMFGPEVLRHMLWNEDRSASLIPETVQNQNVSERMRNLFGVLCRYGSAELRTDLDRYGDFLLAIPGAGFSELNTLPLAEIAFGPGWNT
jgi:subtilisin family serine protease